MTYQHALYRFFASDGTLLYVGITADPGARWKAHSKDKPWWHDVTQVTVEHYPGRTEVLEAERAAIITEHPRHNVVHNRPVKHFQRYVFEEQPWPRKDRGEYHRGCPQKHSWVEPDTCGNLACCDCGHKLYVPCSCLPVVGV